MKPTSELKDSINTSTLTLVLLTIATMGIYPMMWLYRQVPVLSRVTQKPLVNDSYIIWIGVCVGIGGIFTGSGDEDLEAFAGLLIIAANVLYIVFGFKAKRVLEDYSREAFGIELKMNAFYTFAFNLYYANYTINKLATLQPKLSTSPSTPAFTN
jgi:hypothetical protein